MQTLKVSVCRTTGRPTQRLEMSDETVEEVLQESEKKISKLLSALLAIGDLVLASPPLKNGIGEGGDSWNSICGSIFAFVGRLAKWNWGPPTPLLLKVGGMFSVFFTSCFPGPRGKVVV